MFGFQVLKAVVGAGALAVMAGGAFAATCTVGNVSYTATQSVPDAIISVDYCQSGNDKNTIDTLGWTLGDATDTTGLNFTISLTGQTWSILNPLGYTSLLLTFKQGNSFVGFLLDMTEPLTGTWGTTGPGQSVNDLSHASVWYSGSPTLPPVPLPAAGFLLIGALGGLAAVRRRRKAV